MSDCIRCGNCCCGITFHFHDEDLERTMRNFGFDRPIGADQPMTALVRKEGPEDITITFLTKCRNLLEGFPEAEGAMCAIYHLRPKICRDFPQYEEQLNYMPRCGYKGTLDRKTKEVPKPAYEEEPITMLRGIISKKYGSVTEMCIKENVSHFDLYQVLGRCQAISQSMLQQLNILLEQDISDYFDSCGLIKKPEFIFSGDLKEREKSSDDGTEN